MLALISCVQVLEQVLERLAIDESLHRASRPGGRLWLSRRPFCKAHGGPYPFYRCASFGLAWLFENAADAYGGGAVGRAGDIAVRLVRPVRGGVAALLTAMGLAHRVGDTGMPENYVVVAARPEL